MSTSHLQYRCTGSKTRAISTTNRPSVSSCIRLFCLKKKINFFDFVGLSRLKGNKKEEQYRLLWAELETLLIASSKSPGHLTILQCIRECRTRGVDQTTDKVELDQALRELESLGTFTNISTVQ